MLAPLTDVYGPVIRFGIPATERRMAAVGAIALAIVAIVAWLLWPVPIEVRVLACLVAGALSTVLLFRCLRREEIELDLPAKSYVRTHGWDPVPRRSTERLVDPGALLVATIERTNSADGAPESVYRAWIWSEGKGLPLVDGWANAQGAEFLSVLAQRLNITCEPADVSASQKGMRIAPGAIVMWAGVLAVFTLMFWPVLSGRRPFRPVWASEYAGRGRQTSHDFALFAQGYQVYRDGDFVKAEALFRDAMLAGYPPANGYNMLAYALAGQKKLDDALLTAFKALSYAPQDGGIIDTVGEMYEIRKEYKQAVIYYKKALKAFQNTPPVETHAKLGRTLLAMGRRKEAVIHLSEAARYPLDQSGYGNVAISILRRIGVPVPYPARPPSRGLLRADSRSVLPP